MVVLILSFIAFIGLTWCASWLRHQKKVSLPAGVRSLPGPKGLPFIGRVHDVPSTATWLKFWQWAQEFGPIYQMEIFGSVHVWISSEKIAFELLAKRGSVYSDRPVIPNLPDNRTSGEYLPLLGNNALWKRQRKFTHHIMSRSATASQYSYPTIECKRLLYHLSQDPSNYMNLLEEYTGRTISRLAWGSTEQAPELKAAALGLLTAISPSGAVPNVVSWLTKLPFWLSPWKQAEKFRHNSEREFFHRALDTVKTACAQGQGSPCYTKMFLEGQKRSGSEDEEGAYCVGMMAIAGALTIASPLQSYILAMCHFPEWQVKLRDEIERACKGKCPEWSDREILPTLRAVVKEVLRWRPPVPTGIPHRLEKDDIYDGYFIPAGATIHALEWGMTRDSTIYPDPEIFRPERWLDPSFPSTYQEPLTTHPNLTNYHQFGYGRRICQGVEIVEQELFLVMGGMAWAFDFRNKIDKSGQKIQIPWNNFTSLLIAKPEKFEFEMRMNSDEKRARVEMEWRILNGGQVEDVIASNRKA